MFFLKTFLKKSTERSKGNLNLPVSVSLKKFSNKSSEPTFKCVLKFPK